MDSSMLLKCVAQFVVFPGVLERLARVLLSRTHPRLSSAECAVLSQRFTRAVTALSLAQGAVRVLLSKEHASLDALIVSPLGQYYVLGTVVYYLFDSLLLALQKSTQYDIWLHHFFAIVSFSFILFSQAGEQGAMWVLLCETLVPWGFLLFYFKLTKLTAHALFKIVTLGGLLTLFARIGIFSWLTYRLWVPEWTRVPIPMLWMGWTFVAQILVLDLRWIKLYLRNFAAHRKALAALNGAPPPSLASVFRK